MPCFYCGKRISVVRQMTDQDFCSDEHRRRYQDLGDAILRRLSESDSRPASRAGRGPARQPAASSTPAPKPPKPRPAARSIVVPPEIGGIREPLPVPSGIVSAFTATLPRAQFSEPAPGFPELEPGLTNRTIPASLAFLRATYPSVAARSKARPEPPRAFKSRPVMFGAFAPRRTVTPGPHPFGFFLIEPEFRGRAARQRSFAAPRFANRLPLAPEGLALARATACPPASGPIPFKTEATAPRAAITLSAPFAPVLPAAARLPVRSVARTPAPAGRTTQPLAATRICDWRISVPAPTSLRAARTASAAPVSLPLPAPVFPHLTARARIPGTLGIAGPAPNAAPPLSLPAGDTLHSRTASDPLPVVVDLRMPSRVAPRIGLRSGLPKAGVIRPDFASLQTASGLPGAAPAPPLAMWSVRTPGASVDQGVAGIAAQGLYKQPMLAARTRPVQPSELLCPPVFALALVLPDVTAANAWRPCGEFGFKAASPAVAGPRKAEFRPVWQMRFTQASPFWRPFAVSAVQRKLPASEFVSPNSSPLPAPAVAVSAEPVMTASEIRLVARAPRAVYRTLPSGGALLPVPPRPSQLESRCLAEPAAQISRSSALPAVPSLLRPLMLATAGAWMPVLRAQAGEAGPKAFGFLEAAFRAALSPRFDDRGDSHVVRLTGLALSVRTALQGSAPSLMPAGPAAPLTGPACRIPVSPLSGVLGQFPPPPRLTPLPAMPKPLVTAGSALGSEWAFSAATQLLPLPVPVATARAIPVQALLPSRITALAVGYTAQIAAADMPVRTANAGSLLRAPVCGGLNQAAALPIAGRVVNAAAVRCGEEWIIPHAGAIEFSREATQSTVAPRLTPARAVIANVRLTAARLEQTDPAREPLLFPATPLAPPMPACERPGVLPVALLREPLPVVRENAAAARPALCSEDLSGPGAVLNRAVPLPRPGYPIFSFTGYEALDFDDDDTCVLAGAVEPEPPAPVPPRSRSLVPSVRTLPSCEALLYQVETGYGRSAFRPAATADFALKPELAVMPDSISPDAEDQAYAIASGEGIQPRFGWRAGSRLFR